jgi:hypothetical protein
MVLMQKWHLAGSRVLLYFLFGTGKILILRGGVDFYLLVLLPCGPKIPKSSCPIP